MLERQPQFEGFGPGEWYTPDDLFREIEAKQGVPIPDYIDKVAIQ